MDEVKNDVRFYGVLSSSIDDVWKDVKPYLEPAIAYANGKYSIDDIYEAIRDRDMQLWVVFDNKGLCSALVTYIGIFPRRKILFISYVGGRDVHSWLPLVIENFKAFAKEKDCEQIEALCRPGWES
jgi:hypothetical protein